MTKNFSDLIKDASSQVEGVWQIFENIIFKNHIEKHNTKNKGTY